jgi:hypothetical protein
LPKSTVCPSILFGCLTGYDAKPTKSLAENEATTVLLGAGLVAKYFAK